MLLYRGKSIQTGTVSLVLSVEIVCKVRAAPLRRAFLRLPERRVREPTRFPALRPHHPHDYHHPPAPHRLAPPPCLRAAHPDRRRQDRVLTRLPIRILSVDGNPVFYPGVCMNLSRGGVGFETAARIDGRNAGNGRDAPVNVIMLSG